MASALVAFTHHLLAFVLVACIAYEFIAYRKDMSMAEARGIQRVDLAYGITAGLLLIVGLLRVFFFEKGPVYYSHNLFFWTKMTAFLLVAVLSIDPTLRYIRWNKVLRENQPPQINESEFRRTRLVLWLEVVGIGVILLSAAMMARGIGMI
jgi:putative membrane protein